MKYRGVTNLISGEGGGGEGLGWFVLDVYIIVFNPELKFEDFSKIIS